MNIVTGQIDFASGVLIRSVAIEDLPERTASGPGLVARSFLVNKTINNLKIYDNNFLMITKGVNHINKNELVQTVRIGISKAVNLKWRWYLRQSRSISKREKGDKNPPLKISPNKSK